MFSLFSAVMFSSLYNSENEEHFDYPNSIFMYGDDKSKDEANPDFWESEFGEIGPGVTTTPYVPQPSTGNGSMEGKSYLRPLPPTWCWHNGSFFKASRAWDRLPASPCTTMRPVWCCLF